MKAAVGALLALPVLAFGMLITFVVILAAPPPANASCTGGPAVNVTTGPLPGSVAGYSGTQLTIAATIMQAGKDQGLGVRGQTIGVMVGMGESSLTNVMHGDAVGPDSIGVFQQRANGAWGSLADRTNPYTAATNFFRALAVVPNWQGMTPTAAAHAVQRNADPGYYTRYWNAAVQVVNALAGVPVDVAQGTGAQVCTNSPPGATVANAQGWVKPAVGPRTSGFGYRANPTGSGGQFHAGQDIGAACGTPVYAAAAGTVIRAGASSGYGTLIAIDHGGGIVTRYAHAYAQDVLVRVGDHVEAGRQIARVGSNGDSTGCHLHFEVQQAGTLIDPLPFMAARGVTL